MAMGKQQSVYSPRWDVHHLLMSSLVLLAAVDGAVGFALPASLGLQAGNGPQLRRSPCTQLRMSSSGGGDDELWDSLRRRVPTTTDDKFVLPTADQMTHRDVTEKVLRALMYNDSPNENHGVEMLMAYSSPFAKKCDPRRFSSPNDMAKKLSADPDACCVLNCQDFRISHDRDVGSRSTSMIVSVQVLPEDGPWTETCFCLSRVESRWLIDHIGRAAA
mmetsp:Transcript_1596/g.3378  ORF Transcript_1596/g.3378 Transcript_1596/m.3378 type:complete len:218 (+) Transcript_1596:65-718(+)|eukprot:CAMPEP_0196741344 /NCGR_PEP_ID=MMETSP1091-20130531/39331_1 /TAXON_ID=302021 /ORGANISM="Rhodomonas sp., Strain CCMP768" /LENGTH=217 /DNA_ID=CAMNT_0042086991 /DNA_START=61 /DNA_END=714 /DNA_ORIENTATION=+